MGRAGPRQEIGMFLRAAVAHPIEAALFIPERLAMRHEYAPSFDADADWEAHLHEWLRAPWPCPDRGALDALWLEIVSGLNARGFRVGRATYGEYSDAEVSLARAVWCTVVHLRPTTVVETGVARGVTSRIVLEALARADKGHLWSVDLPHLFNKDLHGQTAAAVPGSLSQRWSYVEGSSRRRLGSLLHQLGSVDVFIHDSLHTARNTRFEMDLARSVLAPGGVMIVDDIGTHQGFATFARDAPSLPTLVCPHSDRGKSYFGLVHRGLP